MKPYLIDGMFVFAIYDKKQNNKLVNNFIEKPLYYGLKYNNPFFF